VLSNMEILQETEGQILSSGCRYHVNRE
jgi:hypothetical protein